jgi:hypothetical protein
MIDHNDPRLIDYALGELTPEEAKEFEAELNQPENAEALKAMKEFQTVAGAAKNALAAEPAGQLRAEQREAVIEQAATPANVTSIDKAPRPRRFRFFTYAVVAAACLVLTFAVVMPNLLRTHLGGGDRSIMTTVREIASLSSTVRRDYTSRPPIGNIHGDASSQSNFASPERGYAADGSVVYNDPAGAGGAVSREKAEATRVNEAQPQETPVNRYMADANTPASAPPPTPPAPQISEDRLRGATSEETKAMGLVAASPPPAPGDTAKVAETEADEMEAWLKTPVQTLSQKSVGGDEGHSMGYVPPPAGRDKADAIASGQESASASAPMPEPAPAPPAEKPMQEPTRLNVSVTTAPESEGSGCGQ